jgi:hypothetical protein
MSRKKELEKLKMRQTKTTILTEEKKEKNEDNRTQKRY